MGNSSSRGFDNPSVIARQESPIIQTRKNDRSNLQLGSNSHRTALNVQHTTNINSETCNNCKDYPNLEIKAENIPHVSTGLHNSAYTGNPKSEIINVPPSKLRTKDDFMITWFSWKNEFLTYMKSIDKAENNKQKWGLMLLNYMGPVGQDIQRTFIFDNDHAKENIDILLKNFDLYCIFQDEKRGDDEEIDKYVNNLKVMALKHMTDTDKVIKEKMLMEIDKDKFAKIAKSLIPEFSFSSGLKSLTVKEMAHIWGLYDKSIFKHNEESANFQIKNCNNCGKTHIIDKCPAQGKRCNKCGNENHYWTRCPSQYILNCSYCGADHYMRQCPAYGDECSKCHRRNHFSWKCSTPKVLNCNYCGLAHIASRSACSAINTICYKCSERGHIPSKCRKYRHIY